jgi:uncharacterized integral membrane protein
MTADQQYTQTGPTPVPPPPAPAPRTPASAGGAPAPAGGAPAPAGGAPASAGGAAPHAIKRTRISGLWVAIGCFAVVLLLLLLFILQNSQKVDISYFGLHGHLPLGVALLLAAVCGVLLVALAGTARILQLRAAARRNRRAAAPAPAPGSAAGSAAARPPA